MVRLSVTVIAEQKGRRRGGLQRRWRPLLVSTTLTTRIGQYVDDAVNAALTNLDAPRTSR
jgi:TldD protein